MTIARKLVSAFVTAGMIMGSLPVISTPGFAYSRGYCQSYAKRAADHEAHPEGVLVGTAVGAIGGAVLGGIIGGKRGAGVGAIAGGAGGMAISGIHTSKKWRRTYDRAYAYCRGR